MSDSGNLGLVLASGSPRRRELLTQIGVAFTVQSADVDESLHLNEKPSDYVVRLAKAKAAAVAGATLAGQCVLGADTTVVVSDEVLGKPKDAEDASSMLVKLSGREHQVLTGVALVEAGTQKVIQALMATTTVQFRDLSATEINAYIRCGEPMDKAGAYGIQGLGGAFVRSITGSYSNVVGLPLAETFELLSAAKLQTGLSP
jgi:septum formation protein